MKEPRPNSRKGQVYSIWNGGQGEDQAYELGLTLGLAEGTLRSWFGAWAKAKGLPRPEKVNRDKVRPVKRVAPDNRKRVFHVGDPSRTGIILHDGEQVVEVKWEDGMVGYLSKTMMREAKRSRAH